MMLEYKKSYELIEQFYYECLAFWKKEGEGAKAYELAKLDVEAVLTNPFDPQGEYLDPQAKKDFIKSKQPR